MEQSGFGLRSGGLARLLLAAVGGGALLVGSMLRTASAAESPPVASRQSVATLVTDTDHWQPGHPFALGLRLRLAPGWHTYWHNPGDAGAAPELTLALPPGARASSIAWPAPQRLAEGPLTAYAYTGDVLLPVTITPPPTGGGTMRITAQANWLACASVCVPQEAALALTLPAGAAAPSAETELFQAAAARTPRPSPFTAHIAPDGTLSLTGSSLSGGDVRAATFFPAEDDAVVPSAPQRLVVGNGWLTLSLSPGTKFDAKSGLGGVLVLRNSEGRDDVLNISATEGAPQEMARPMQTGRMLLFALLGGLVLNLMPCVFPVLAMKAVGLARLSGAARGEVRAEAASYTIGVLAAFAGLGATVLGLRAAGVAAGWGFQFQSPVFVAAAAALLFAVGLGLSGVVTVGGRLAGAGQSLATRRGHAGSFFTGLLAVLVATPCTAPFMGVAVAAAFSAPPLPAFAVFLAMGVGLASPTALLGVAPGLVRLLPRPGGWMEVLKQALAFPMYAAAAWLLWVLSQESGPPGVLACGAVFVLIGFAAWAWRTSQTQVSHRARRAGRSVAFAAMLAGLAVLVGLHTAPRAAEGAMLAGVPGAEPFTEARLAALRAEGRPVFVNMTAAWCVTCLINERLALSPAPVREAFASHKVAYLLGDWTRQDPQITGFLRKHGRDGVPLYVYYPGEGGPPTVLPQLLTEQGVLRELTAGG